MTQVKSIRTKSLLKAQEIYQEKLSEDVHKVTIDPTSIEDEDKTYIALKLSDDTFDLFDGKIEWTIITRLYAKQSDGTSMIIQLEELTHLVREAIRDSIQQFHDINVFPIEFPIIEDPELSIEEDDSVQTLGLVCETQC